MNLSAWLSTSWTGWLATAACLQQTSRTFGSSRFRSGRPTELSFMLSYVLEIDSEEKQRLLEMTSSAERLRVLVNVVEATIRKLEQQLTYKEKIHKVRGNGDLGRPGTPRDLSDSS